MLSRNVILCVIPLVGLLGCESVGDEGVVESFDALEEPSGAAEADGPAEQAIDALKDADRPSAAPVNRPYAMFVAPAVEWRYLDQTTCASNYPTGWTTYGFDDSTSAWATGRSELGYGDDDEHTVIPHGTVSDNCTTQLFRFKFDVADPGLYATLVLQLLADDGAAVWLNGTLIKRYNLPSTFGFKTVASSQVDGSDEDRFIETTGIPIPPGQLLTQNILAVEVHQRSKTNPDVSFNLSLLGELKPLTGLAMKKFQSDEATIDQSRPNDDLGNGSECEVDGATGDDNDEPPAACLATWDISSIPDNATILAAHLVADVESASPDRYEVYELKTPWEEFDVTWNDSDTSTSADWAMMSFSSADFADPPATEPLLPLTVVNAISTGSNRTYALPPDLITRWRDAMSPPAGIAFVDPVGALLNENGLNFDASEEGIELVVLYTTPTMP